MFLNRSRIVGPAGTLQRAGALDAAPGTPWDDRRSEVASFYYGGGGGDKRRGWRTNDGGGADRGRETGDRIMPSFATIVSLALVGPRSPLSSRVLPVVYRQPSAVRRHSNGAVPHGSAARRPIRYLQRLVNGSEPLRQLLLRDDERWDDQQVVPVNERVHAQAEELLAECLHLGTGPVEWSHRLTRFPVFHELEGGEEADRADVSHARVGLAHVPQVSRQLLAHRRGTFDKAILAHHADVGYGGCKGDRMPAVGKPALEHAILEEVGDFGLHRNRAQRGVRRCQPFSHRHQIGHDAPMIHGEPLTGPAEPAHDLVTNQQDLVAIANGPDTRQIAVGRHDDPVCPGYRLDDDGGDRLGPLIRDDLLEVIQVVLGEFRLGRFLAACVEGRAISVGIEEVNHPGHDRRFPCPAARITGGGYRTITRPMV